MPARKRRAGGRGVTLGTTQCFRHHPRRTRRRHTSRFFNGDRNTRTRCRRDRVWRAHLCRNGTRRQASARPAPARIRSKTITRQLEWLASERVRRSPTPRWRVRDLAARLIRAPEPPTSTNLERVTNIRGDRGPQFGSDRDTERLNRHPWLIVRCCGAGGRRRPLALKIFMQRTSPIRRDAADSSSRAAKGRLEIADSPVRCCETSRPATVRACRGRLVKGGALGQVSVGARCNLQ
jgi:hypothetical protein